jgi:hypothetical protein
MGASVCVVVVVVSKWAQGQADRGSDHGRSQKSPPRMTYSTFLGGWPTQQAIYWNQPVLYRYDQFICPGDGTAERCWLIHMLLRTIDQSAHYSCRHTRWPCIACYSPTNAVLNKLTTHFQLLKRSTNHNIGIGLLASSQASLHAGPLAAPRFPSPPALFMSVDHLARSLVGGASLIVPKRGVQPQTLDKLLGAHCACPMGTPPPAQCVQPER